MAQATVRGILIEHDGVEYLLGPDQERHYPDLLVRRDNVWVSLKTERQALDSASALFAALGVKEPNYRHTQTFLRELFIEAIARLQRGFFGWARWN